MPATAAAPLVSTDAAVSGATASAAFAVALPPLASASLLASAIHAKFVSEELVVAAEPAVFNTPWVVGDERTVAVVRPATLAAPAVALPVTDASCWPTVSAVWVEGTDIAEPFAAVCPLGQKSLVRRFDAVDEAAFALETLSLEFGGSYSNGRVAFMAG